jgi:hypothetical protein
MFPPKLALTPVAAKTLTCTALYLITSLNGNTVRNFPTHGQLSAAKGGSATVSRSDIRLIQYLDSSALWFDGAEVALIGYFPIPYYLTCTMLSACASAAAFSTSCARSSSEAVTSCESQGRVYIHAHTESQGRVHTHPSAHCTLSLTSPFGRRGLRVAEQGYLALLDHVQAVLVVPFTHQC